MIKTNNFNSFIESIKNIEQLTEEEEKELFEKIKKDNDPVAKERILTAHLRYIAHFAFKYKNYGLSVEDLMQEGTIGLLHAMNKFDPNKNVRFATFSSYWIKNKIFEYIINNWKVIKVATTKAQKKLFFNIRKYMNDFSPLTQEQIKKIAKDLNVNENDVIHMEKRIFSHDVSFYEEPYDEDDIMPYMITKNMMDKDERFNPEKIVSSNEYTYFITNKVKNAFDKLSERDKNIIWYRKIAEEGKTLTELAKEYNVSAERIRQLENKALNKIKNEIAEYV